MCGFCWAEGLHTPLTATSGLSHRVCSLLQCEREMGLRQALETLVGGRITELAWERATLPTCCGCVGRRATQLDISPAATHRAARGLHMAVLSKLCARLQRPTP